MRTTEDQRLSLRPDQRKELRDLADDLELSINKTVALAVSSLRVLVGVHEEIAANENVEPDIGAFYRRVAHAIPAHLVEPKREMGLGWTNETKDEPAIQIEGWFITADPETNELLAVNSKSGERGRIADGGVHDLPVPSPKDFVPN